MTCLLEICAGSMRSALAAQKGGADRIELCDNMAQGGTTPSYGMIAICKKLLDIPVFPIIRPRGGNFLYSEEEFEVMKKDVSACAELGCEGVVFGILRSDGSIDMDRCSELINLAKPMQVTFHRAFDHCNDLEQGLEDIIRLGFTRVLTSGGERYAVDGIQKIKGLVQQAKKKISIMPGSGVTHQNILELIRQTGAYEFHSTAKKVTSPIMRSKNQESPGTSDPYETNAGEVKKMKDSCRCQGEYYSRTGRDAWNNQSLKPGR